MTSAVEDIVRVPSGLAPKNCKIEEQLRKLRIIIGSTRVMIYIFIVNSIGSAVVMKMSSIINCIH